MFNQLMFWSGVLPYNIFSEKPIILTADTLDHIMGLTPADNVLDNPINISWLSSINGQLTQQRYELFEMYQQGMAFLGLPSLKNDPLIDFMAWSTSKAVQKGMDPDLVAVDNYRIESAYAEKIKQLVIELTSSTGNDELIAFNRDKCQWMCESPSGQASLLTRLAELQMLEWQYHSAGETRLKAYKKLLRSLNQVIAGQVISDDKRQPYRRFSKDGQKTQTDEQYLASCERRFLELLAHDAFDVFHFATNSPWSKIGGCHWEEVEGSAMNTTRLRHYPLPVGIKPNGKTLYVSSPMINQCDIFDLAPEKSVLNGVLEMGYDLYMVDFGNPGPESAHLGLDYFGKTVHDTYIDIIKKKHPNQPLYIMAYCMGGTLVLPYLARRTEELAAEGKPIDIDKVVLMSTPIMFDDDKSGNKPMRDFLRKNYNNEVMKTMFGSCNVPPQSIEIGLTDIQPGVPFTVYEGFFDRASYSGAIIDAAPFLYWLNSGTRFPAKAHQQWVKVYMQNEIWENKFCLPSRIPELDGKPVNMDILNADLPGQKRLALFDYRGLRDPIAPPTACVSSERWGNIEANKQLTSSGLNRTIEKNIGHIFVVSKALLAEFLKEVANFYADPEPILQDQGPNPQDIQKELEQAESVQKPNKATKPRKTKKKG
ncbi:MAG: alpha/beta fold hydrolase [Ignavibacteriales bacterium]